MPSRWAGSHRVRGVALPWASLAGQVGACVAAARRECNAEPRNSLCTLAWPGLALPALLFAWARSFARRPDRCVRECGRAVGACVCVQQLVMRARGAAAELGDGAAAKPL